MSRCPGSRCAPIAQRYSCNGAQRPGPDRALRRALPTGFKAELPLDADGLVLDYPGLFRRLAPR